MYYHWPSQFIHLFLDFVFSSVSFSVLVFINCLLACVQYTKPAACQFVSLH